MADRRPVPLSPAGRPVAAVIPALDPPPTLLRDVRALRRGGLAPVIVVDDGSAISQHPLFDALAETPGVAVLRHGANQGKGRALRTALRYLLRRHPEVLGAVTMDADGQHLTDDAVRLADVLRRHPDSLVLGCRRLGAAAPWRSRIGNHIARRLFRVAGGLDLRDTQCGLRALPRAFLPALLTLPSRGYDFESDMLLLSRACGLPIREAPVSVRYVDGNAGSHFHPIMDSLRIGRALVRRRWNVPTGRLPDVGRMSQTLEVPCRHWTSALDP